MRNFCNCKDYNKTKKDRGSNDVTRDISKQRRRRRGLLSTACIYTPLLAGAFFGWGPFQLMLEQNGNFHGKCSKNATTQSPGANSATNTTTSGVCPEQTASLLNIPLISQALSLGMSPAIGLVCDRFGAPYIVFLMTIFITSGLGMIVVASYYVLDQMILPGFILFGFGAVAGSALTVQTGLIWRNHRNGQTRMRIISLLNNLYDAGAITPLMLWYIIQWTSHESIISIVIGSYLAFGVAILSLACFFWSHAKPLEEDDKEENVTKDCHDERDTSLQPKQDALNTSDSRTIFAVDMSGESMSSKPNGAEPQQWQQEDGTITIKIQDHPALKPRDAVEKGEEPNTSTAGNAASHQNTNNEDGHPRLISERSPMEQLRSLPFLLLCVYFALSMMINLWTLTTARDFLASLGDDEYNNMYLTIFTVLTPVSILGVPIVDVIVQRFGYHGGMQAVNVLSITQGIIKIFTTNLNVQILGFIVYSFFRSFFFSVTFSFLPTLLSLDVTGKGAGILTFCGILSFVNAPIANITVNKLDGNFLIPNVIYTLLGVPCIALAFWIERIMRRERAAAERKEEQEKVDATC